MNYQNVRLQQRIVDARQVNYKSRENLISGIKEGEDRVRLNRVANMR